MFYLCYAGRSRRVAAAVPSAAGVVLSRRDLVLAREASSLAHPVGPVDSAPAPRSRSCSAPDPSRRSTRPCRSHRRPSRRRRKSRCPCGSSIPLAIREARHKTKKFYFSVRKQKKVIFPRHTKGREGKSEILFNLYNIQLRGC